MKIRIQFKNHYNPTPKSLRQLGDVLLWSFSTITAVSAYMDIKWLALSALLCGIVGKALTNMYEEDKPDRSDNTNSI